MGSNRRYANFFGVYLLFSMNPTTRKKTYIGFTVDPNKRLRQHNRGSNYGGAKKTDNRGPWEMILIVHGFPTQMTALRFEWAWQNPFISRRLKLLAERKSRDETVLDFDLKVLKVMLNVAPWNRLNLNIKWLSETPLPSKFQESLQRFRKELLCYEKDYILTASSSCGSTYCNICINSLSNLPKKFWKCFNDNCDAAFHIACLAKMFISEENVIPVSGACPECHESLNWVELVSTHV